MRENTASVVIKKKMGFVNISSQKFKKYILKSSLFKLKLIVMLHWVDNLVKLKTEYKDKLILYRKISIYLPTPPKTEFESSLAFFVARS